MGIVDKCPDVMTVASSSTLFGTFQSALLAIVIERDSAAWRLEFDMALLVIVLTVTNLARLYHTYHCFVVLRTV